MRKLGLSKRQEKIRSGLEDCLYLGSDVYYYNTTDSTMDDARELISRGTVPDGVVIIAEQQTNGRGRFNREWYSPQGGVYLSLILYPQLENIHLGVLSLLSGLAACEAIREYIPDATTKWVNDVLVGNKKISGVLIENQRGYSVVGIGVNTNNTEFPDGLEATSIALETGITVPNDDFIIRLLRAYDTHYKDLKSGNYKAVVDRWRNVTSTTPGKRVKLLKNGEESIVTVRGVNDVGHLVVEDRRGRVGTILSGEISYL